MRGLCLRNSYENLRVLGSYMCKVLFHIKCPCVVIHDLVILTLHKYKEMRLPYMVIQSATTLLRYYAAATPLEAPVIKGEFVSAIRPFSEQLPIAIVDLQGFTGPISALFSLGPCSGTFCRNLCPGDYQVAYSAPLCGTTSSEA